MATLDMVSLVVFTSEGREHLLKESLPTFFKYNTFPFFKSIIAVDGNYDTAAMAVFSPDLVLQQYKRKGYIASIRTALNAIETPYFFGWRTILFLIIPRHSNLCSG